MVRAHLTEAVARGYGARGRSFAKSRLTRRKTDCFVSAARRPPLSRFPFRPVLCLFCRRPMRITALALVPPPSAADLPKVTPELLASVLARYSRSNEGLASILAKVDLANPDASIDRILKFVDYGHASIGGLTGGLAVAIDGVSMWLAYKLFEIAHDGGRTGVEHPVHRDRCRQPSAPGRARPAGRSRRALARGDVVGVCRLPRGVRAARRGGAGQPGARAHPGGGEARRRDPPAEELRARPRPLPHPARDADEPRPRPVLADVGRDGEAARFAAASGGAPRRAADPRRAGEALAAPDAAQLRGPLVRGAGRAGTRRQPEARAASGCPRRRWRTTSGCTSTAPRRRGCPRSSRWRSPSGTGRTDTASRAWRRGACG